MASGERLIVHGANAQRLKGDSISSETNGGGVPKTPTKVRRWRGKHPRAIVAEQGQQSGVCDVCARWCCYVLYILVFGLCQRACCEHH